MSKAQKDKNGLSLTFVVSVLHKQVPAIVTECKFLAYYAACWLRATLPQLVTWLLFNQDYCLHIRIKPDVHTTGEHIIPCGRRTSHRTDAQASQTLGGKKRLSPQPTMVPSTHRWLRPPLARCGRTTDLVEALSNAS